MDKQYENKIRRARRKPKAEIPIDLLKTTQKISNWRKPDHDFWIKKKIISIHDTLALGMNKCLQGSHGYEEMTKENTTVI